MTRPYILLVEDNAQNCYMATYLLESGGFEVACVETGAEALAAVRRRRPDLLLTDIQLPEMDGYELGSRLRGDPEFRDLPLMALTSYAMPGDRQKAFALGFNGYLEKPINPETFLADVRQVLGGQGSAPCAS
jgi:CheY-like chemotaxis protein